MNLFKYSVFVFALAVSFFVSATRYWPAVLTEWRLSLNNEVAYISSPQFAQHCSYLRGQINMSGTDFDKALCAYALSAKARGKKLSYVVDSEQTVCVISGLEEVE